MALKYDDHLAKEIKNVTNGKGVKVVFDATGSKVFESALHWYELNLYMCLYIFFVYITLLTNTDTEAS